MIKISIIIPAYNAAKTIHKCLNAFEKQKFNKTEFEVIFVDDGSVDNTLDILQNYKNNSKLNLHIRSQKNQGPGIARNLGVKAAQGKVIAFTDSDCAPDSNWLDVIHQVISTGEARLIGGEVYTNETVIYPWKMSPAGQKGITANLALPKTLSDTVSFSNSFKGLVGSDTDYISKVEQLDPRNKYQYISAARVEHPPNTLNFQNIVRRAKSRINEFELIIRYGKRGFGSMNIIYRPFILQRFSLLPFTVILPIILIIHAFSTHKILFDGVIFLIILFYYIFFGYKFFVTNGDHRILSIKDKLTNLFYLYIYNVVYLFTRVKGSIQYERLIL